MNAGQLVGAQGDRYAHGLGSEPLRMRCGNYFWQMCIVSRTAERRTAFRVVGPIPVDLCYSRSTD